MVIVLSLYVPSIIIYDSSMSEELEAPVGTPATIRVEVGGGVNY